MIAPFPLDDLTVLRCFPDQRAIDALTDPSALEHSQLLAAFQCGKLFNEARYWLFASVIQDPSFLDRGLSQLNKLAIAARGLTNHAALKERIQQHICSRSEQLADSFGNEDFAESLQRQHDGTELFFEEVTGPICASFEMLELGITRFCAASPAKLLWSLGIHLDTARHLGPSGVKEAYRRQIAINDDAAHRLRQDLPIVRTTWLAGLETRCKELEIASKLGTGPDADVVAAIDELERKIAIELRAICTVPSDRGAELLANSTSLPREQPTIRINPHQSEASSSRLLAWQKEFPELEVYEQNYHISVNDTHAQFKKHRFNLAYFILKAFPGAVPEAEIAEKWRAEGFGDSTNPRSQTIRNALSEINSQFQRFNLELVRDKSGRRLQRIQPSSAEIPS